MQEDGTSGTFGAYQRLIYQFSERTREVVDRNCETNKRQKEQKKRRKYLPKEKKKEKSASKKEEENEYPSWLPYVLRRVFDSRWRGINRNLLPLQTKPAAPLPPFSPSCPPSRLSAAPHPPLRVRLLLFLLLLLLLLLLYFSPSSGFLQDPALRAAPPVPEVTCYFRIANRRLFLRVSPRTRHYKYQSLSFLLLAGCLPVDVGRGTWTTQRRRRRGRQKASSFPRKRGASSRHLSHGYPHN